MFKSQPIDKLSPAEIRAQYNYEMNLDEKCALAVAHKANLSSQEAMRRIDTLYAVVKAPPKEIPDPRNAPKVDYQPWWNYGLVALGAIALLIAIFK
jgi:hypothetical protein